MVFPGFYTRAEKIIYLLFGQSKKKQIISRVSWRVGLIYSIVIPTFSFFSFFLSFIFLSFYLSFFFLSFLRSFLTKFLFMARRGGRESYQIRFIVLQFFNWFLHFYLLFFFAFNAYSGGEIIFYCALIPLLMDFQVATFGQFLKRKKGFDRTSTFAVLYIL
jgi:hypothetical protein